MNMLRTGLMYFDQAVRSGSIRKAADVLHVASSALNRQLLLLEEEVGVPLFERMPRGIRPTAAGEILLSYVRRWDRETLALKLEMTALRGGVRGSIRIAAAETTTECILPRAIAALNERFPQITFNVMSGDNHRITSELLARDVDIALVFDASNHAQTDILTTVTSPIGVIMRPDHPLARLPQVTISDCAQYPFIAPGKEWLQHSGLRSVLSDEHLPFETIATAERPGILKSLVQANLGIAFLNEIGIERESQIGSLHWVPLAKGILTPSTLSVLVPRGRVLPHYCHAFVQTLKAEMRASARFAG